MVQLRAGNNINKISISIPGKVKVSPDVQPKEKALLSDGMLRQLNSAPLELGTKETTRSESGQETGAIPNNNETMEEKFHRKEKPNFTRVAFSYGQTTLF